MMKDGKGAGFKGIGGETSTPPNKGSLTECLRHETDSEHGFLGLVQQFISDQASSRLSNSDPWSAAPE
jgi:hypothetical protein